MTVKQINHEKYHEDSKMRTRQFQYFTWQLEIHGKSNYTTENLNQKRMVIAMAANIAGLKGHQWQSIFAQQNMTSSKTPLFVALTIVQSGQIRPGNIARVTGSAV